MKIKWTILLLTIWIQHSEAQSHLKPPNIVFFLVDDLGWKDIEPSGTTFYETPNINSLAAEALYLTNAYAASPVCSPTRASIMTGKHPARMQTTDWFGAAQPEEIINNPNWRDDRPLLPAAYREHLSLEETTLGEAFKNAGYKTFFAGKWHLGEVETYWPEHQGFDINIGGHAAGHPKSYFSPYQNPRLKDGPQGEHLTARLAAETADFIDANKDHPFFAFLSFYAVHTPLQGRKDLVAKYEAKIKRLGLTDQFSTEGNNKVRTVQSHATYAAMVEAMDQAAGTVLDKLKEAGLYDHTIIVFFSDNGGLSTSEGHPTSNTPLRAGKGWLYEGGIREPLLIRWPGHTKGGSTCNEPVSSTDLYPTLLQMAGQPFLPEQHKDGHSLVPLLKGKNWDRKALFWHYPHYSNQGGSPGSAVRADNWKLIRWYEDGREELYNLGNDIGEQQNLLDKHPSIANKLRKKLNSWLKEQGAQMATPNPYFKKTVM